MADEFSKPQLTGLEKKQRLEARERIESYHKRKLTDLMKEVRRALYAFDKGKIDAFELDNVIHTYHKQSKELFIFINLYYPSNDKLPALLALIDEEERGVWSWGPESVLAEEIRDKL